MVGIQNDIMTKSATGTPVAMTDRSKMRTPICCHCETMDDAEVTQQAADDTHLKLSHETGKQ